MPVARVDSQTGYFHNIDHIRTHEYPVLKGTTYLDHTGTTLYARSLVTTISEDLVTNLFGNPHSGSSSSQLSSSRIEDTRLQVLRFLNADPDLFDVVFVANATAAIKLVAEAFRDHDEHFFYAYHVDSHTSLVGVRELADLGSECLYDDDVDELISALEEESPTRRCHTLFGYPGQSNLSGYRPPLAWCSRIYHLRNHFNHRIYSLYDAAARLSTASLDFRDSSAVPDFTALSFYKIFGLPDLGALIVRKECSEIFRHRKFFGGGTVDMVISIEDQWHASKGSSLHSRLEDGTVPFHNIIALGLAFAVHSHLFGSMSNISRHTRFLARRLHDELRSLKHSTGSLVCHIYGPAAPDFFKSQGPTIAFNLRDADGNWIGKTEVEKLASIKNIQFRTGGLCNPGGIASHLDLTALDLRSNFAAGQKCGDDNDILGDKPTGVIRVSLGAMSNIADVDIFVNFIREFFVQQYQIPISPPLTPLPVRRPSQYRIQSLSVFPIKSCAAFKVPLGNPWEVRDEGLAWDREWCLIHQGTGMVLNQKRYPRMTMVRPSIDLDRRMLLVQYDLVGCNAKSLEISIDREDETKSRPIQLCSATTNQSAIVCGERQEVQVSTSALVADFFTTALGVPCTLARHRTDSAAMAAAAANAAIARSTDKSQVTEGYFAKAEATEPSKHTSLANESPILLVSQSSVDNLNLHILSNNSDAKPVLADSFRANIVIAPVSNESDISYAEDGWTSLQMGDDIANQFHVIGPCHRCQMVCVDQQSATRSQEPFSTLAKTRRRDGKVWFGIHLRPAMGDGGKKIRAKRVARVGDVVVAR